MNDELDDLRYENGCWILYDGARKVMSMSQGSAEAVMRTHGFSTVQAVFDWMIEKMSRHSCGTDQGCDPGTALEVAEAENKRLRCALEAALNTAETYSKMLSRAAVVAENIGRLWGDRLPEHARVALAGLEE